jgi:hypothetical protein
MVFKQLFNILKTKLSTIPELKNIDWYLDQDKTKGGIINTPTVLVRFEPTNPNQVSKKSQSIEVTFEIKLYTDFHKSIHKLTSDSNHFDIEQSIFEILVNYEQTGLVPASKDSGFLYSSQTYITKLVCALPLPPPSNIIPSNIITLNINTP